MVVRHILPIAALALALGALGPWAHGTYVEQPIFDEERASERTVSGWEAGGIALAFPAVVAAAIAWFAPDRWAARVGIFLALALCAIGLGLALSNDGLSISPVYFEVFAEWRDVSLGWGLVLASVAWVVAFLICGVWFLARRDAGSEPT